MFDAPSSTGADGARPGDAPPARPGATPGVGGIAGNRVAILTVAGAIAIGGLAVVVALSGSGGEIVEGPAGITSSGMPSRASVPPAAAFGEVVVDVAGAVVAPGVYRLTSGSRVVDAVEAAGGFSPRVDVGRVAAEVNLAAALADGQQVRVPSRDDPAPAGAGSGEPGSGGAPGTAGGSGSGQILNLNRATQAELETLPGIGPVTAGKILESRAGAAFKTVDELRERGLVGEKTFEKIRALLTAG